MQDDNLSPEVDDDDINTFLDDLLAEDDGDAGTDSRIEEANRRADQAEHKFKSLEGALSQRDKELNKLNETIQNMEARFNNSRDDKFDKLIETLATKDQAPQEFYDADTVERYADTIPVAEQAAQKVISESNVATQSLVEELKQEIEALKSGQQNIQREVGDSVAAASSAAVRMAIPDSDAIINSPEFGAWLDEQDKTWGLPKRSGWESHATTGNYQGLIDMMSSFKNERGIQSAPTGRPVGTSAGTAPQQSSDIDARLAKIRQKQAQINEQMGRGDLPEDQFQQLRTESMKLRSAWNKLNAQ